MQLQMSSFVTFKFFMSIKLYRYRDLRRTLCHGKPFIKKVFKLMLPGKSITDHFFNMILGMKGRSIKSVFCG